MFMPEVIHAKEKNKAEKQGRLREWNTYFKQRVMEASLMR